MKDRLFALFALVALTTGLLTVTLGGVVRITGSGLGCPDWPLCHGRIVPPPDVHAWIEYIHRLAASTVVFSTAAVAVAAWRSARTQRSVSGLAAGAGVLLVAQALLGALVVLYELPPVTALVHTTLAMGFVGTLVAIASAAVPAFARIGRLPANPAGRAGASRLLRAYGVLVVLALVLIVSGAYVYRWGASLACLEFPLCGPVGAGPSARALADAQMLHRLLALAVGVALAWALVEAARVRRLNGLVLGWSVVLAGLYLLQVAFGVSNVLLRLPEWARLGHLVTAALFFATACLVLSAVWRDRAAAARPAAPGPRVVHAPAPGEAGGSRARRLEA